MKKRILAMLLPLVMAVCLLPTTAFASSSCNHNPRAWNTTLKNKNPKEASCVEDGNISHYTCTGCTDVFFADITNGTSTIVTKETVTIPAVGHDWDITGENGDCNNCDAVCNHGGENKEETSKVEATCTTNGSISWKCKTCKKEGATTLTSEGHKWDITGDNGDCTNCDAVCNHDGENKEETSKVEATCTTNGSISWKCKTCKKEGTTTLTSEGHKWNITGENGDCTKCDAVCKHEGENKVVTPGSAPSCTATGYENWNCATCGKSGTNLIEKTGHSWNDDGTCDNCDAAPECVHSSNGGTIRTRNALAATCQTPGYEGHFYCIACQKAFKMNGTAFEEIPMPTIPAGHDWDITGEKGDCKNCDAVCNHDQKTNGAKTEPTCLADGSQAWTCNTCGKPGSTPIATSGHSWNDDGTCSNCDAEKEPETDCAHSLTGGTITWVPENPATCEEDGNWGHYFCSVCKQALSYNTETRVITVMENPVIDATGHDLDENGKCGNCDYEEEEETESTCSHSLTGGTITWVPENPATCEEDGNWGHYFCSVCKQALSYNTETRVFSVMADPVIDATGHDLDENGKCGNCDYEEEEETESECNHTMVNGTIRWLNSQEATCIADGYDGHNICIICNKAMKLNQNTRLFEEMEKPVIPATGHSWNAEGKCGKCGAEEDSDSACNHAMMNGTIRWKDRVAATCEEAGYEGHHYCVACGKAMQLDQSSRIFAEMDIPVIPATGHRWDAEGKCDNCDAKKEVESACKHVLVNGTIRWKDRVAATCLEEGCEGHHYCAVCEKPMKLDDATRTFVEMAKPVIPATGHTWNANGVCACGATNSDVEVAPSDCTHPSGVSVGQTIVEPTCEAAGYILTRRICNTCGEEYEQRNGLGNAIGHNWKQTITPATCDEDGNEHYECTNCGDYYDVAIKANGHTYVDGKCACGAAQNSGPSNDKINFWNMYDVHFVGGSAY